MTRWRCSGRSPTTRRSAATGRPRDWPSQSCSRAPTFQCRGRTLIILGVGPRSAGPHWRGCRRRRVSETSASLASTTAPAGSGADGATHSNQQSQRTRTTPAPPLRDRATLARRHSARPAKPHVSPVLSVLLPHATPPGGDRGHATPASADAAKTIRRRHRIGVRVNAAWAIWRARTVDESDHSRRYAAPDAGTAARTRSS